MSSRYLNFIKNLSKSRKNKKKNCKCSKNKPLEKSFIGYLIGIQKFLPYEKQNNEQGSSNNNLCKILKEKLQNSLTQMKNETKLESTVLTPPTIPDKRTLTVTEQTNVYFETNKSKKNSINPNNDSIETNNSQSQLIFKKDETVIQLSKMKNNEHTTIKDKNKKNIFRVLLRKREVYDSLDDEEIIEDAIINEFYFNPNSLFIFLIDLLIAIISFYYLIFLPYYLAKKKRGYFDMSLISPLKIFLYFTEFIFIVDFFINFFKAYYDYEDNLIKKRKKIIQHYLQDWFLLDLITALPIFTLITIFTICKNKNTNNLFYLFTLIKIFKMFKIINTKNNRFISILWENISYLSFIENWGTIIYEISLFIFGLHISACMHIFIGKNSYPNWIISNGLADSSFHKIYITSIYFLITTLTSVGYGDMTSYSFNEHVFQIFLLLIGIIAYSWLISSASNYIIEKNKEDQELIDKLEILDEIKMSHPEFNNDLYGKIRYHLEYVNKIQQKNDKKKLLEDLPLHLKNQIMYEINKNLIKGLKFFKYFHNITFINCVIDKFIPVSSRKNDIIIECNEIIDSMIFVKQGRLSLDVPLSIRPNQSELENYMNGNFLLDNQTKDENFGLSRHQSIMSSLSQNDFGMFKSGGSKEFSIKRSGNSTNINFNKNKVNIRIIEIRREEHFGEIFMFLNKKSPFNIRVKSQKAELMFLKKLDAIKISSKYCYIWKRVTKNSLRDFVNLKELVSKRVKAHCMKNGIIYNKRNLHASKNSPKNNNKIILSKEKIQKKLNANNKNEKMRNAINNNEKKHTKISNNKKKNNKIRNNNKMHNKIRNSCKIINKNNIKIKRIKKNSIIKCKSCLPLKIKLINFNFNMNDKKYIANSKLEKKLKKEKKEKIDKNEKNKLKEEKEKKEILINLERNDKMSKSSNCTVISKISLQKINIGLMNINNEIKEKEEEKAIKLTPFSESEINDEIHESEIFQLKINKNTISQKLENIDTNSNKYYYNINLQHSDKFSNRRFLNKLVLTNQKTKIYDQSINKKDSNKKIMEKNKNNLSISNSIISFEIKSSYDNLNSISKGEYFKDTFFQSYINSLIKNKYDKNNKKTQNEFISKYSSNEKIQNLHCKQIMKVDDNRNCKKNSGKLNKNKNKKHHKGVLTKIKENINENNENLNNPDLFYNELFNNIMNKKSIFLMKSGKNIKSDDANTLNLPIVQKRSRRYSMPFNIQSFNTTKKG